MRRIILSVVVLLAAMPVLASTSAVSQLQSKYQAAGAGPFTAAAGQAFWNTKHNNSKVGKQRDCTGCHTKNLKSMGKHVKTGKEIKPMAPSVNPERFTDAKKVKKWFRRNCKWVLGRECTAQEKGDVLQFLSIQ
ncbi:MAG TPA: DUF1924 domain-containing protein [Gammaproteobacteria bacterium]|nr:DUF1924 domain-containing protein [Gammaproteobacteria bacterium]